MENQSTNTTKISSNSVNPNKRSNGPSRGKTKSFTQGTSQGPKQSRDQKRKNWAKKNVPKAKPVAPPKPNVKEYLCECHSEPARKLRAGQQEMHKDAETGKIKSVPRGLGKWKCSVTGRSTKVTPRKLGSGLVVNNEDTQPSQQ
jgi:hypothetical protein